MRIFFQRGSAKSSNCLGSSSFLILVVFHARHDINQIGRDPGRSFKLLGICRRFGIEFFEEQSLALDTHHAVQQRLKNIGDDLAAARFGDDPGRELIRRGIDVIDLDARETLLEGGKNGRRVNLRQGRVEIERAALGQRSLINFIERLRLGGNNSPQKQRQRYENPSCSHKIPPSQLVVSRSIDGPPPKVTAIKLCSRFSSRDHESSSSLSLILPLSDDLNGLNFLNGLNQWLLSRGALRPIRRTVDQEMCCKISPGT